MNRKIKIGVNPKRFSVLCVILYAISISITVRAESIKADHNPAYHIPVDNPSIIYIDDVNTEVVVNSFSIQQTDMVAACLLLSKEKIFPKKYPALFVNDYQRNCFYVIRRSNAP